MRFFVALLLRMTPINAVSGWKLINKTGRKNPMDKDLELALSGLDWTDGAIRKFGPSDSFIFRDPRASRGPNFLLELNLKRLDLVIAPGADVFSFPHIISGI